jgi:predicted membrane protein
LDAQLTEQSPPVWSPVKLIVGLFFTALGLLLTADNLDLFNANHYLRYWPAVLVLIGVVKLFDPALRIPAILLTVVGGWMLAYNLELIRFTLFDLWPLLLIALGAATVIRAVGGIPNVRQAQLGREDSVAIFGSRKIHNTSHDFRGGRIAAMLGGYELDLTDAQIAQSPAYIDTFAFWGGIEIFVPDDWEIVGEVTPIMGGFEIKTRSVSDPKRRLVVRGVAIMAGIEVKSAPGRKS